VSVEGLLNHRRRQHVSFPAAIFRLCDVGIGAAVAGFPVSLVATQRPSTLCKRIVWISSINKAGTAACENPFHPTDRFSNHVMRLAGLKLVL
jgi:hypothetical protein